MEFTLSPKTQEYAERLREFMDYDILPSEQIYFTQREDLMAKGLAHQLPPIVEELKAKAKSQGLWNLFLPNSHRPAHGLSVTDYATLAEITGWSPEIAQRSLIVLLLTPGTWKFSRCLEMQLNKRNGWNHYSRV